MLRELTDTIITKPLLIAMSVLGLQLEQRTDMELLGGQSPVCERKRTDTLTFLVEVLLNSLKSV